MVPSDSQRELGRSADLFLRKERKMSNARQKARGLVELAMNDGTTEKERLSAAIKAVGLIHKHDLLASPLDGLLDNSDETVQAATHVFNALTNPDLTKNLKKVADRFRRSTRARSRR
jgi:hypothetical protein